MRRVVLQPVGDRDSGGPETRLERVRQYFEPQDFAALQRTCPSGSVHIQGKQQKDLAQWREIEPGDLVLFTGAGCIHTSGKVVFTSHNRELGLDLWRGESGVWEYLIFISERAGLDLTYERFNELVGYKSNYVPQGFRVLDRVKSEKLLSALGK
jgi:hypothetical protein